MGRELRRVPLDFGWPLREVWKGFINPHYKPCPEDNKTCFNGLTASGQWLETIIRLLITAADSGLRGDIHPYLYNLDTAPTYNHPRDMPREEALRWVMLQNLPENRPSYVVPPTKELAELVSRFDPYRKNGFPSLMGGSAGWGIQQAIRKAAHVKKSWGVCPVCKGKHIDPAVLKEYNHWRPKGPPKGKGWQLWETVSEGSPISPVFPTREKFIEYLVGQGYSQKAAENFASDGWVPSAIIQDGKMYENIEAAAVMGAKE